MARHRIERFGHFVTQDSAGTDARLTRMVRDDENIKEPDVTFFAMATLITRGLHPPGGSDPLGTQNFATNPWVSISVAVSRGAKYGAVVQPDEAISVMDQIATQHAKHLDPALDARCLCVRRPAC